ncbi:hypothetical protein P5V15_002470 [Pogonomyrmex californicus]
MRLRWNRCVNRDVASKIYRVLTCTTFQGNGRRRALGRFHLASESVLRVTEVAFEMWATNSSLTFERDSMNPDIVLSFRKGFHTFVDPRHRGSRICPSLLDGPGNMLAHAFLPSSEMSEVHVDNAEKWHIELTANPNMRSATR